MKETIYIHNMTTNEFNKLIQAELKAKKVVVHSDIHYVCNPTRDTEFFVHGLITFEIEQA